MSTSGSIESRPLSGQRAAFDSEKCHSISIKQVAKLERGPATSWRTLSTAQLRKFYNNPLSNTLVNLYIGSFSACVWAFLQLLTAILSLVAGSVARCRWQRRVLEPTTSFLPYADDELLEGTC